VERKNGIPNRSYAASKNWQYLYVFTFIKYKLLKSIMSTFDCASIGIAQGDECVVEFQTKSGALNPWWPGSDDPYVNNKLFNTPLIAAVVGGVATKIIFSETKAVNIPILGNVGPGIGMGVYIGAGTFLSEYFEKAMALWGCRLGVRRFAMEIMPPLYAGLAAQGLSYLGGNDLGLDAFFIGTPAAHIGKYIANAYVNQSPFYTYVHTNGIIPSATWDVNDKYGWDPAKN